MGSTPEKQAEEFTPFSTTSGELARTALDSQMVLSGNYWAELRVFLTLSKLKSFAKTADALLVNQKTVARQVRRLEDKFGAQLIVRTSAGVRLTASGIELAKRLAVLDYELFKTAETIQNRSAIVDAVVRVGITDGLGAFMVASAIPEFRKICPNIAIEMKSMLNAFDIRANSVDVLVTPMPPAGDDVEAMSAGMVHFVPFASKFYIEEFGVPNKGNLERQRFVSTPFYETAYWQSWLDIVPAGISCFRSDSPISYATMVKAGIGIGLLGSWMSVDPHLTPLELNVHIKARLFVVGLKESLERKSISRVANWLARDRFSTKNPWFADDLCLHVHPNPYDVGLRRMLNVL